MGSKTYTKRTAAERQEQAKALQSSIAEQVENLRGTEQWRRYLDFVQAFHTYSLNNVLLILSQCPEATQVAGFRKWQQFGRQVRKGEKALKIFGYSTKKIAQDGDQDENPAERIEAREDEKEQTFAVRVRFPVLSVFDMSQTEPIEGAEQIQSPAQLLTGEDTAGVIATVTDWLTGQGWSVTHEPIAGETNGYTKTDGSRRVVVDRDLSPAAAAKTLLHEAAHVILHADKDHAEYVEHRGTCETEAESVAYVVAGMLGIDTSAYSIGYITGWSEGDAALIKDTAQNVLRASHTLADLFNPDTETVPAA